MQTNIYPVINELINKQASFAICTIVQSSGSTPRHIGSKMTVNQNKEIFGSVGGGELEFRVINEAIECINTGKPKLLSYKMNDLADGDPGICGGQLEIFVEPIKPITKIVVIGGGHVGKALVKLAKWLGFIVVLSDDREEFCNPISVPDADAYVPCNMAELPSKIDLNSNTYIILTTRGVRIDVPGLPALLETNARYIGIIGSKRRWITCKEELLAAGVGSDKVASIHSPIGINIAAETPEEIAMSIMAEILMHKAGTTGDLMDINSPKLK